MYFSAEATMDDEVVKKYLWRWTYNVPVYVSCEVVSHQDILELAFKSLSC